MIIPREAIEEEEDEESDENESEEDEQDGERGREVKGEEKRTQSLDRGLRKDTAVSPENTSKDRQAVPSVQVEDPFGGGDSEGIPVGKETLGRGTLGRGKQSRGTMLWSSDAPPVPTLWTAAEDPGVGLTRSDSIESAVHIGRDEVAEDAESESEPVPKDEIELLEEQGKIPVQPSASPPPQALHPDLDDENVVTEGPMEDDDMEEVKLEDEVMEYGEDTAQHEAQEEEQVNETPSLSVEEHEDSPTMSPAKPVVSESDDGEEVSNDEQEEKQEVLTAAEEEKVDEANEEAREAI